MIIREAPKVMLRYKKQPDGKMFLQHAMLEENTETGEKRYAWENVPVCNDEGDI
jgi:hypothetical protein